MMIDQSTRLAYILYSMMHVPSQNLIEYRYIPTNSWTDPVILMEGFPH